MSDSAIAPGAGVELPSLVGPLAPYTVQLLLATHVPLDAQEIARAIAGASGEIDAARLTDGAFSLAYLDHRTDFKDRKRVPMTHLVCYLPEGGDPGARAAALQQMWDWPDPAAPDGDASAGARAAVQRSRAVLSVSDMAGLQYKDRLALFQRLVRALITRLPVLAIHWVPSQRIVDPAKYVVPDPRHPIIQGPVNVRSFKVREHARGTLALDTLGLAALGLRDLQVVFDDPAMGGPIGGWLLGAASLVFERGDFLGHRDTVDGVGGVLRCHHEAASLPPAREVVDFRPELVEPVAGHAREGIRCPSCGWVPEVFSRWECECGFMWNTFETRAVCPACSKEHLFTRCHRCREFPAHGRWYPGLKSEGGDPG